jgi:hypothetical protein
MAISFSCGQCGNDYVVSDGLAGKSAICKACGARMTVPGSGGPAGTEAPTEVAPSEDATPAAPPAAPVTRPNAPPRPASTSSPSGGGRTLIRLLVFAAAVGVALYSRMGRSTKTDVRAFHQRQVELLERVQASLKGVKDVPSAKAASGPLNQTFRELREFEAQHKDKKARKTDIDAVQKEFGPREEALQKEITGEMFRVAIIPGAMEALDLQGLPDPDAGPKGPTGPGAGREEPGGKTPRGKVSERD